MTQVNNQQFQGKKKQKIIGEYIIGKTLGVGTFASVREGIHIRTQEKVSIKILNKSMIEETRDKINLSREMRILKKIRHPNIAQLLQIMETNSRIYFVMELVEGGELYTKITSSQKGRLSERQSAAIFQQLLNAVQYLHKVGIAHRDIKPQNILLDKNNHVKLIDFGLSTFYQKNQKLKTSCGSPCYAAPEMLIQQSYDPLLSDIWSTGVVLYAMVCGYLPFEDNNTKLLYQKIRMGYYEQPKFLSSEVKNLISSILKFLPEQRPSIKTMRQHTFCTPALKIVEGLLPGQTIKLQQDIIYEMNTLGYYGFRTDVQAHKNVSSTAAYYLLLYKKLKNKQKSLQQYFAEMTEQHGVKSPYKSKSLVLKKIQKNNSVKRYRKGSQLGGTNRSQRDNQEESDFLDKLIQKNITKMRQRSMSIRVRKMVI